jgi:hypothetical protein
VQDNRKGFVMSWRLNAGNETEVMDARGRNVARAHCGGSYGVKLDEAEAHARLIAAAPDMLAALVTALGMLVDSWGEEQIAAGDDQVANVLKAAIAKAKGEA